MFKRRPNYSDFEMGPYGVHPYAAPSRRREGTSPLTIIGVLAILGLLLLAAGPALDAIQDLLPDSGPTTNAVTVPQPAAEPVVTNLVPVDPAPVQAPADPLTLTMVEAAPAAAIPAARTLTMVDLDGQPLEFKAPECAGDAYMSFCHLPGTQEMLVVELIDGRDMIISLAGLPADVTLTIPARTISGGNTPTAKGGK